MKMSKSLKKQLLNIAFVVILIGITITVLLLNYKELNFKNIGEFFATSNVGWIIAAFGCMLLFILFEALSLHFIVRCMGFKSKFRSSIAYSTADTYYSAITPSASGGQPASAYYMTRDGMGAGRAGFSLVFNLIGYTSAIIVIGIMALCINPGLFLSIDSWFARFLIIFGVVMQLLLLGLFIGCMYFGKAIKKVGNLLVSLLTKMHIVKKPDKWRAKIDEEIKKYAECRGEIKKHPSIIFITLIFNILQRVSQTLIPCFICLAADPSAEFWNLFVCQAYVLFGYNCVPLPGGVGAYEYLYLNIYNIFYGEKFIVIAMMISRLISYYFCIAVSGIYTLVFHMVGVKKVADVTEEKADGGQADSTAEEADEAEEVSDAENDADEPEKASDVHDDTGEEKEASDGKNDTGEDTDECSSNNESASDLDGKIDKNVN